MENATQLAIITDCELKAMEVRVYGDSWRGPHKVKPMFPHQIPKVLYKEEIEHLSSRVGAKRFKKIITPPDAGL